METSNQIELASLPPARGAGAYEYFERESHRNPGATRQSVEVIRHTINKEK